MSTLKMAKMRSTGGDLMEDLVVEILSRTPALSLARFRSTSKPWNTLIKDGKFAKKHSANAPKQSLVILLIDLRVCIVSLDLLRGIPNNIEPSANVTGTISLKDSSSNDIDIRSVYHCEGLLLCGTKDKRLVVWNPCTGETRWIQPRTSYKEAEFCALGYDNKSSCFKILRRDNDLKKGFEIYDFTSNSWRDVGNNSDGIIYEWRGLSIKENIYWIFSRHAHDPPKLVLLNFDFSTNTFQRFPLPFDPCPIYYEIYLSVTREEEQRLCLLRPHREISGVDVWIATKIEGTGSMSWTKLHHFHFKLGMNVLTSHESKVCNKQGYVLTIVVGEDIYIQADLIFKDSMMGRPQTQLVLTYVPSLIQIHQGF